VCRAFVATKTIILCISQSNGPVGALKNTLLPENGCSKFPQNVGFFYTILQQALLYAKVTFLKVTEIKHKIPI